MIDGISREKLSEYVLQRQKIDDKLRLIYSLSHLMAGFEKYAIDSDIVFDPVTLGHIHQMINKSVLDIWEILDDFIYLVKAKSELAQFEE